MTNDSEDYIDEFADVEADSSSLESPSSADANGSTSTGGDGGLASGGLMLSVSARALSRLREILQEKPLGSCVRLKVSAGGCAGWSYDFALEESSQTGDLLLAEGLLAIDVFTAAMLTGSEVDWEESLSGSSFVVRLNAVSSSCSCGVSFVK